MSRFEDEFDDVKEKAETWWRTADGRTKKRAIVAAVVVLVVLIAVLQSCVQGAA